MTTPHHTTDADDSAAPIACTLTTAVRAAQVGRWARLAARAMTGRAETADGLRVAFRSVPGAEEELRSLAAVEQECCSWAAWTVETDDEQIVLAVHSTGEGVAALHGMFTGLPGSWG
jgi:hypothetical protein